MSPSEKTVPLLGQRIFVTLSMIACLVGTLYGVGVLGERVEESSGGALAADATLLAPAGTAFSIWSVIYAGLVSYTVWQWLGSATPNVRARGIGWLAGLSMLLNAAWLLVTQQGWIWVSVLVILALAAVLGLLVRRLTDRPARGAAERLIVDGTFGLYLGWVAVATCANITAAAVSSGIGLGSTGDQVLGVVVVLVAAGLGVVLAWRFGGRLAVAAALSWGLAWIAVGRLVEEPSSLAVGIAAILGVALVLAGTALARKGNRAVTAPAAAR